MAQETVEFGSFVPKADYDYFKENFPQYGAVKWFITTSLHQFCEQVRASPTAKEQIEKSIEEMVQMNRLISTVAAAE